MTDHLIDNDKLFEKTGKIGFASNSIYPDNLYPKGYKLKSTKLQNFIKLKSNNFNLLNSLQPFFYFNALCGLKLISIKNGESKIVHIFLRIAFGAFVCVLVVLGLIFGFPSLNITDNKHFQKSDEYMLTIRYLDVVFVIVITIYQWLINYKKNAKLFHDICDLDRTLQLNHSKFFNKYRWMVTIYILLFFVLSMATFLLDYSIIDRNLAVDKYISRTLLNLEIVIVVVLVDVIIIRYRILNAHLQKYAKSLEHMLGPIEFRNNNSRVYEFFLFFLRYDDKEIDNMTKMPCCNIEEIIKIYQKIAAIVKHLNSTISFQMMIVVCSTLLNVLMAVVDVMVYVHAGQILVIDELQRDVYCSSIAMWVMYSIVFLAVMCFACDRLLEEDEAANIIFNKVALHPELPGELREEYMNMSRLMEVEMVDVSVYKLFSLNTSLLLNFASLATSYIIIIVQFLPS